MENIIDRWYSGGLYPFEEISDGAPDHVELAGRSEKKKEYLKTKLSPEDRDVLEGWEQLLMSASDKECRANFTYGFKLGIMIMSEVFSGNGGPLLDD